MGEFQLHFCSTPEDYTKMFEVPCGSCMVLNPKGYMHDLWHYIKDTFNLYPSAWYHYEPHSRGVWLEEDGKLVARAMVYREDANVDVWPLFNDIKAISFGYGNKLEDMLSKKHKRLKGPIPTITIFDMPGIDTGLPLEGVVCPLPHCDAHRKDFSVTYDISAKIFTFYPDHLAPDHAYKIEATYNHNGFIRSREVIGAEKREGLAYEG